jgi:hypothetical protein
MRSAWTVQFPDCLGHTRLGRTMSSTPRGKGKGREVSAIAGTFSKSPSDIKFGCLIHSTAEANDDTEISALKKHVHKEEKDKGILQGINASDQLFLKVCTL